MNVLKLPNRLLLGCFGLAFAVTFVLHLILVGFGVNLTCATRFGDVLEDGTLTPVGWIEGLMLSIMVATACTSILLLALRLRGSR